MKPVVFVNGLLLLFLIYDLESAEEQEMNLTTLAQIIDFFEQNYNNKEENLYAVAINVPRNQCQGNFYPLHEPFSTLKKDATDVKNAIYESDNKFYKGEYLMAAGPFYSNCKEAENCKCKSVSVLLPNYSLQTFENFLQHRENDSCVVIYTVYSPCLNSSNITQNLINLKNHTGIKALVFKKVYKLSDNNHSCSDLAKNFTEIVNHVPFYHFVNKTYVMPITNEC